MKKLICSILILHFTYICIGQGNITDKIDSLDKALKQSRQDTTRIDIMRQLGELWQSKDLPKSTQFIEDAFALAQKSKQQSKSYGIMFQLAYNYTLQGNAPKSINILQELIRLLPKNSGGTQTAMAFLSFNYKDIDDYNNALLYAQKSFELNEKLQKEEKDYDPRGYYGGPMNLAEIFEKMNRLDSALCYAQISYQRLLKNDVPTDEPIFQWKIPWIYGKVESRLNNDIHALELHKKGLIEAQKQGYNIGIQSLDLSIADHFNKTNQIDSAILYAIRAFESAVKLPNYPIVSEAGFLLKTLYEKQNNPSKALYFSNSAATARDSFMSAEKIRQVQELTFKEERRQKDIEAELIAYQTQLKQYALLGGLLFFLIIAFFLYRNMLQKQKLNEQLRLQKTEIENLNNELEHKVEERTAELKKALDEVQLAFNKGQTSERKRVSADLHDEIGSALSTIAIFSDLAKTKAQKFAPELVMELERIGTKSRDMIQTMRDTIWTLKEDSRQSIWERMYISSFETLKAKDMTLHWQLPNDNDLPNMPFNTKRHLFLAYKEAINNIIKHAEATTVTVEIIPDKDIYTLKITDKEREINNLSNYAAIL